MARSIVRLKDVAERAGLSVTQVSRALNGHDDVSPATKERIREIAQEMGYIKNVAAQKLATQTSNQIALVIKGMEHDNSCNEYSLMYSVIRGIEGYTSTIDYDLTIYALRDNVTSYLDFFAAKGITSAIMSGFDYNDPQLAEVLESHIPCVCIDIPVTGDNNGCVITNNVHYAYQAVEALIKSGKKNIAMINGKDTAIVSMEREMGYKIALTKNHIPLEKKWILKGEFDRKIAREITLEMIEKYPEIDGFFCASDYMAVGCIEAINKVGKKIPEEIGVIGFDDIPIAAYLTPTLSTVRQDNYKKGYVAAQIIHQIIRQEDKPRTITLECELKLRGSI